LRSLLPALAGGMTEQNALTVKLLLATCVRTGELIKAEWQYIDFDRAEWVIPDEHSKTKRGFTVPLSGAALTWFRRLEVLACGSPFVLPRRSGRGHGGMNHSTLNVAVTSFCAKLEGVRPFTPHDLRSTARSHLSALGVSVIVAERCLNHSLGGMMAVYDQHDYLTERRQALRIWADFLTACESGEAWRPSSDNVVSMRRAV
jgi:integrase